MHCPRPLTPLSTSFVEALTRAEFAMSGRAPEEYVAPIFPNGFMYGLFRMPDPNSPPDDAARDRLARASGEAKQLRTLWHRPMAPPDTSPRRLHPRDRLRRHVDGRPHRASRDLSREGGSCLRRHPIRRQSHVRRRRAVLHLLSGRAGSRRSRPGGRRHPGLPERVRGLRHRPVRPRAACPPPGPPGRPPRNCPARPRHRPRPDPRRPRVRGRVRGCHGPVRLARCQLVRALAARLARRPFDALEPCP